MAPTEIACISSQVASPVGFLPSWQVQHWKREWTLQRIPLLHLLAALDKAAERILQTQPAVEDAALSRLSRTSISWYDMDDKLWVSPKPTAPNVKILESQSVCYVIHCYSSLYRSTGDQANAQMQHGFKRYRVFPMYCLCRFCEHQVCVTARSNLMVFQLFISYQQHQLHRTSTHTISQEAFWLNLIENCSLSRHPI